VTEPEVQVGKDTSPCRLCNRSLQLDAPDVVFVPWPGETYRGAVLCLACAGATARAYQVALLAADLCEHGVQAGEWCPECNRDYREAVRRLEGGE
jgi:hypothetical protein